MTNWYYEGPNKKVEIAAKRHFVKKKGFRNNVTMGYGKMWIPRGIIKDEAKSE